MKKILALVLLFIVTTNCEKDDICPVTMATTPKLIIRFYDITDQTETLRVLALQVQGDGNEDVYQSAVSTDSLPLPLKTFDNITRFKLHKEYADDGNGNILGNEDIIDIEYITEEVYVSRACGYKTIFDNVRLTVVDDGDNWIKLIQFENPLTVDNETAAHVQIFH